MLRQQLREKGKPVNTELEAMEHKGADENGSNEEKPYERLSRETFADLRAMIADMWEERREMQLFFEDFRKSEAESQKQQVRMGEKETMKEGTKYKAPTVPTVSVTQKEYAPTKTGHSSYCTTETAETRGGEGHSASMSAVWKGLLV